MVFNYESENALLISLAVAVSKLVFLPILGVRKCNKHLQLSKIAQKEPQN